MNKKIKWGIIGPGNIAKKFTNGLLSIEDAICHSVLSRKEENAKKFCKEFGFNKAYSNLDAFLEDSDLDIVYIATPHPWHFEYAKACLEAKKAVLCEKPITINAQQLKILIKTAKDNKVFLMEALWTRFLPSMCKLREVLNDNPLGNIRLVKADFAFNSNQKDGRLYQKDLGGGGLLDVGVYTLSFADMILGSNPIKKDSSVIIGSTGVDENASVTLRYENDKIANLFFGVNISTRHDAYIYCDKGFIYVPDFWHSNTFTLNFFDSKKDSITYDCPFESTGYNYEAIASMECLSNGLLEHKTMPLETSLNTTLIMDELRNSWNLKYPSEE